MRASTPTTMRRGSTAGVIGSMIGAWGFPDSSSGSVHSDDQALGRSHEAPDSSWLRCCKRRLEVVLQLPDHPPDPRRHAEPKRVWIAVMSSLGRTGGCRPHPSP
jgi:hypothetical protein